MPLPPQSFEEALAVVRGENLESFRRERAFEKKLYEKVEELEDTSPDKWPALIFNWDMKIESQRFSLDGTSAENFKKYYPHGFASGWVCLRDFDKKLCHFSRRDTPEELWGTGCKHKLAKMIRYLSLGLPISPPLVKPLNTDEVAFQGGHHRYAAAKAVQLLEIPIHVEPQNKCKFNSLFPVRWSEA